MTFTDNKKDALDRGPRVHDPSLKKRDTKCPACGTVVELGADEKVTTCPKCRARVSHPLPAIRHGGRT